MRNGCPRRFVRKQDELAVVQKRFVNGTEGKPEDAAKRNKSHKQDLQIKGKKINQEQISKVLAEMEMVTIIAVGQTSPG